MRDSAAVPKSLSLPTSLPFTVRWPDDASRVVPLPATVPCTFMAAQPFTLVVAGVSIASTQDGAHWVVPYTSPEVARPVEQVITWQFPSDVSGRTSVLWLPEAQTIQTHTRLHSSASGAHGVLANTRGAAVQARASWGVLESKYDAWLSANLDLHGPGDRRVVLPLVSMTVLLGADRMEVGPDAVASFECSGDSLRWLLTVHGIQFSVLLRLGKGNAILALWKALTPVGRDVQVLLRPAVDDRSFHHVTKAFAGAETEFPLMLESNNLGFAFQMVGGHRLRVQGTAPFAQNPQWRYCVALPQETSRGLEDLTDVFTPGQFSWRPAEESEFEMTASVDDDPAPSPDVPPAAADLPLPAAVQLSLGLYLSRRDDDLTVIAGFPWFLDWGRDSLIFCRGLIACGRVQEAGQVLRRFGSYEKDGMLPNLLRGEEVTNWETSDAPLWWIVAAGEWLAAGGDIDIQCNDRTLPEVMRSIVCGYCQGTSNGVRLDPDSGLIFSPAHHSWMDTDQPCGTPRRGYPIEIQALWAAALAVLFRYDADEAWSRLATQVQASIERYFWREDDGFFADCLHAEPSTPARSAVADDHLRPNQWLAIALGAIRSPDKAQRALAATQCLLIPGGARSLAPRPVTYLLPVSWDGQLLNDPQHPYWPRYAGPENVSRKPAYHNGTAWCWLYPVFVDAMVKVYGSPSLSTARRLMSASSVPWHGGCAGQIPENLDGDLPHLQRGCGAQAWSISEWVRVWHLLEAPPVQI